MQKQIGILVVEDDEDDFCLFKRAWLRAGFSIPLTHVGDGAEAMELLEKASRAGTPEEVLPKIVLTDLKMPRVSGFQLLEFLKSSPAFNRVMLLVWSNSRETADVSQAYELGVRRFFPKPATDEGWRTLIEQVKEFYDGSSTHSASNRPNLKVYVQQEDTGFFLRCDASWSDSLDDAFDFKSSLKAIEFCLHHKITDAGIVLGNSDPRFNIVLRPFRHEVLPKPQTESQTS